jgi:hypothetical protein
MVEILTRHVIPAKAGIQFKKTIFAQQRQNQLPVK